MAGVPFGQWPPPMIAFTLLGIVLLALVQFDIWATVLHPDVESPLSNRFQRTVWLILSRVARRLPQRQALLHAGLPLLVGGLILVWLGLLWVGFALLYFPWIGDPASFGPQAGVAGSFLDALYLSGAILFTVGFGDITPVAWPFKLLAVAEAGSGMATISLSVTYVLGVYPALARQRACATALDAEVAGQVGGLPLLRRYLQEGDRWHGDLTGRLRELALELLALTESHEAHPVLYYAHPPRVQQSVLRVLLTVQHLLGLLRYGLAPERHATLVANPQVLLLEQAFDHSLRRLSASLHSPANRTPDTAATREDYLHTYRQICDALEHLGLVSARQRAESPVPGLAQDAQPDSTSAPTGVTGAAHDPALDQHADSPEGAYLAFRQATDPPLTAYAIASGYTLEEALRSDDVMWRLGAR